MLLPPRQPFTPDPFLTASPPVFCFLLCLEGELVEAYDKPFFLLGVEGADDVFEVAGIAFSLDDGWSLDSSLASALIVPSLIGSCPPPRPANSADMASAAIMAAHWFSLGIFLEVTS